MKKTIYILTLLFSMTLFGQSPENKSITEFNLTEVRVYPNPFSSKATVSFNSVNETSVTFIVQNLLGKVVASQTSLVHKGINTIPFYRKSLTSGIYIYTLKTKNKVVSKRFVIK